MGKQNIKANIAKHGEALEKMALDIWAKPEAGFREFNATKLQQDYLKNMGAKITSPVDVVETAFIAEYGSGKPIIGILGEFDALPGKPEGRPDCSGPAGAGCLWSRLRS